MSLLAPWLASPWSERIAWTLLHSAWQIAAVTVVFGLATFALRRASANTRYLLGCLALVVMVAWPAATFVALPVPARVAVAPQPLSKVVVPSEFDSAGDNPSNHNPRRHAINTSPPDGVTWSHSLAQAWSKLRSSLDERIDRWTTALPWLTAFWIMGVCVLAVRPLVGLWSVRRLQSRGLAPLATDVRKLAGRLLLRLRINAAVQFAESALVEVPTVVGYLRPMVLLPATAITGLSRDQLELILAHELAHIRRHDYLVNLMQTAIEALLFYHPGMWWVSARIRQEREHCCDDVATACCGSREQLARALFTLESRRAAATPALAATGGAIVPRIRRLLQGNLRKRERPREWLAGLVTIALLAAILPLGALTARSTIAANPASESSAGLDSGEATKTVDAQPKNDVDDSPAQSANEVDPNKPWVAVGRVKDNDGKPMAGVEVKAFAGYGTLRNTGTATTDANGRYRLAFGPGIHFTDGSNTLQAATISARMPGYYERNLNRQGNGVAGQQPPEEDDLKTWGRKPSDVFLPGEAKSIDFVMAPAAVLEGEFVETSRNWSVRGQDFYLTGEELPPSQNVLDSVTTDRKGRFRVDAIPTGRKWRIGMRVPHTAIDLETGPVEFDEPGVHRAKLVLEATSDGGTVKMSLRYVDLEERAATEENQQAKQEPSPLDQLDGDGFSQLHRAASGGHVDKVRELLEAGADIDVEQRTYHGTPLQYAASHGHGATVQMLLDHDATVGTRDTRGRTPLAWAAQNGHGDVVQRLVDAGAAVNSRARGGWTPLHYAVDRGHVETAQYLIDHGADLHARNSQPKNAVRAQSRPEFASALAGTRKAGPIAKLRSRRGVFISAGQHKSQAQC